MRYLWFILLFGCNPVKQVLKDKAKLDLVAKEVIKKGYCVNDTTVIEKIRDSVVYKDSIIERINNIPCKDFDTTIGRARIKVSSGVLSYTAKDSTVYRVKTITNTVRDRVLESILQEDIDTKSKDIELLKNSVRNSQTANKDLTAENRWLKIKFWLVIVAALAVIFRKQLIRIANGFI